MTARIIYHDFQNEEASLQAKEPRLVKIAERVNTGLNATCIFLCGACSAIGVLVILMAALGG